MNLAIVLYGGPFHIRSQVSFFVIDTSANYLTRISIKKYKITKRSDRAKVTLDFRTSWATWAFLIIGRSQNHSQVFVWSLKSTKAQQMQQGPLT